MIGSSILRLTKDSIVYGLGSALTSFIGIALVPLLTRIFSPSEYGAIDLLVSIVFLANVVFAFGFDSATAILFFDTDEEEERKRVLFTGTAFVVGVATIAVLVLLPFGPQLSRVLFDTDQHAAAIRFTLATIPFLLCIGFGLAALRYHFARRRYLIAVAVNVIATIGLTYLFLLPLSLGVRGYFLAWLSTGVLTTVVLFWLVRKSLRAAFSGTTLRSLLVLGLPLVPAGLAGWSLSLINRFFLNGVSQEVLGWFSLGVKISSILGLAVAAIQLAWGPFALSLAKHPGAQVVYAKVLTVFTAVAGFCALLLAAFAPEFIAVVSDPDFAPASRIVGILSLGLVAYGSYYIVSIAANVAKKTAHVSWTTALAAGVNILLNALLIPRFGMMGAAAATLVAYALSSWLLYRVGQRFYPIPYEQRKVASTWILLLIGVAVFAWLPQTVSASLVAIKLLILAAFLLALPLFRIIERNELTALRMNTRALLQRLISR